VTCTYSQPIELKTRRRANGLLRDAILAIAVVVIFVPFALIPLVIR